MQWATCLLYFMNKGINKIVLFGDGGSIQRYNNTLHSKHYIHLNAKIFHQKTSTLAKSRNSGHF